MEPEIRYTTTADGVSIAYYTMGEGLPLVVTSTLIWSDLRRDPFREYRRGGNGLGRGLQVVRYDARGTGLSDRKALDFSIDARLRDLEAVVERLKLTRFAIFGPGNGAPAAIAYAAGHPERVSHLILKNAHARGRDQRDAFRNFDSMRERADEDWERYTLISANSILNFSDTESARRLASAFRESMTPESLRVFMAALEAIDVTTLLPRVAVPTLVMYRGGSRNLMQLEWSREVASKIPDARFVTLAARDDLLWTDEETRTVEDFLGVSQEAPASSRSGAEATIVVGPQPERSFATGRYLVKRMLGEGAQKTVYLVHDTTLDRDCAVALVKSDLAEPEDILRIRREAQTMARLGARTNIVTVHDLGEEDGRPYIVCEYVPGGDLRAELRAAGGPLAIERAVAIATDVARALVVAHARGVVHRDLKPSNVLMNDDGSAKLGDFGIAFSVDRSRMTIAGALMGTAAYLAPEQALGEQVDARSDLYSLGAMLYELVTGQTPFPGDDAMRVVAQHINATPTRPSVHNPTLPEALDGLILRLLAKAPDDRPASAAGVIGELDRIAQDLRRTEDAGPAEPPAPL